jgi:hypothetical protein
VSRIRNTKVLCEQSSEFLNVSASGTHIPNYLWDLKGETVARCGGSFVMILISAVICCRMFTDFMYQ